MTEKMRIDLLLVQRGLVRSREEAQGLVMAGSVLVDGVALTKPGHSVSAQASVEVTASRRFVSRGGDKLLGALEHYGLNPAGLAAVDLGASTGGFTDCLLQHGARRVYAVDVGYGQFDFSLRARPEVVVLEKTNARFLKAGDIPEPADLVVIDVSFISLDKILPAAAALLRPGGRVLALIKPQFEAGRGLVRKGVIRDPEVHRRVIESVRGFGARIGLVEQGEVCPSPLLGPKGNREFFILFSLQPAGGPQSDLP